MVLGAIWQFMDRDVAHKILYGPKRTWGPYTILWVTDLSINCHLARSAMNYLLYYTQYLQICQSICFLLFYIFKTKKQVRTTSGRKHYIDQARSILYSFWLGPRTTAVLFDARTELLPKAEVRGSNKTAVVRGTSL
jgi:hypothetical protein